MGQSENLDVYHILGGESSHCECSATHLSLYRMGYINILNNAD